MKKAIGCVKGPKYIPVVVHSSNPVQQGHPPSHENIPQLETVPEVNFGNIPEVEFLEVEGPSTSGMFPKLTSGTVWEIKLPAEC